MEKSVGGEIGRERVSIERVCEDRYSYMVELRSASVGDILEHTITDRIVIAQALLERSKR